MFKWVAKNSKFAMDKWRFDKTDSYCSVAPSKSNAFLLIYCKLKTNFTARSPLLYMGCLLTRERKQKKTPIFIFKSVRVHLRESVCLRECVNTEFDWGVKGGFEKVSVSRAVCLWQCPLAESWLYLCTETVNKCLWLQMARVKNVGYCKLFKLFLCVFKN